MTHPIRALAATSIPLAALLCLAACSDSARPLRRGRVDGGASTDAGPFCADRDGDTICDAQEGSGDLDGDGLLDADDPDADGDGASDAAEAGDTDLRTPPRDGNGDGVPDFLDPVIDGSMPPDAGGPDVDAGPPPSRDGGGIYDPDAGDGGSIVEMLCPPSAIVPTGCVADLDEGAAGLCNELDDDCDGEVDERCGCAPGLVQPCFRGPPGRRGVGACADGMQRCLGSGEFGAWGACEGGLSPGVEACNGIDDDCNGCSDEVAGCVPQILCPAPGDPRVADGAPFVDYPLRGGDFFSGEALSWSWTVAGGPCDDILPRCSYTVTGASARDATFRPTLSGDYTVTMTVVTSSGETLTCTWIVHVRGPGLRIEMCYPESETQDLDLFLSRPSYSGDWYLDTFDAFSPARDVCGWHNCEATIRGSLPTGGMYPRASWGYADSPLSECEGGPLGLQWRLRGACANPRLDIDNNLSEGIGVPENINVDAPREGERFRVMVQNFTGRTARPVVNVYCGGRRVVTYGLAPDVVPGFAGTSGSFGIGAMWRVGDVVTHVDAAGETTCDVTLVHPPGSASGYDVTYDNPRF
jgi:hypothetical protein